MTPFGMRRTLYATVTNVWAYGHGLKMMVRDQDGFDLIGRMPAELAALSTEKRALVGKTVRLSAMVQRWCVSGQRYGNFRRATKAEVL